MFDDKNSISKYIKTSPRVSYALEASSGSMAEGVTNNSKRGGGGQGHVSSEKVWNIPSYFPNSLVIESAML